MSNSNLKTLAVILAAGRGNRMQSKGCNKTALIFRNKPILEYGLDLFRESVTETLVVKGAFSESVQKVVDAYLIKNPTKIKTVTQRKRLGTGHAALVADKYIQTLTDKPDYVLLGYGDHLMFYKKKTVTDMVEACAEQNAAVMMVAATVPNPTGLGRLIFNEKDQVVRIVEEKVATEEERKINTINASLYCFRYDFFHKYLKKIKKNPVSGEYYITDLVEIAVQAKQIVLAHTLHYKEVGIGINTKEEKEASESLYAELECA